MSLLLSNYRCGIAEDYDPVLMLTTMAEPVGDLPLLIEKY